ncbi:ABC transporter substrate-binding protein [Cohnella fermenti]|uniref:Extracellular solute-binding protein n=1 Tax=Cohnella fermenti TaxID=2565925 RepID=A0A4S4BNU5_9BACL|nr:extracellular solute-binding protein [Cohnella fermenti]THF76553.1 extracellular solute-binding protein [Cohnella fermenti]
MKSRVKPIVHIMTGLLLCLPTAGCFHSAADSERTGTSPPAAEGTDELSGGQRSAGANPAETEAAAPAEPLSGGQPVTLKVDLWLFTPTTDAARTKTNPEKRVAGQVIADKFMKLYPNVTIEWVRGMNKKDQAELASYYTTHFSAGDAPDIGMSWNQFTEENWYLPLDRYLDEPNPFVEGNRKWIEQFPAYLWENNLVNSAIDGTSTGIPISLYSGPATAIFYNKAIFEKEGIPIPDSYLEFIETAEALNAKGYIGLHPWTAQNQIYNWAYIFNLGPYYFEKNVAGGLKQDANGHIDNEELMRAIKEGMLSPVRHAYARELYANFKKLFEVSPPNWEYTDFSKPWAEGQVAMFEDGTWLLNTEEGNKERGFEFGMFPPVPLSVEESPYVSEPKYTEGGPYQPEPSVTLNILRSSVERHGTEEAAVRFLQFLTAPDNISLLIQEDGTSIGAVEGVPVPDLLQDWISRPFPITPKFTWPTGLDAESFDQWNQYTSAWVNGKLNDDTYFAAIDEIQSKAADRIIQLNDIDTSGWRPLL